MELRSRTGSCSGNSNSTSSSSRRISLGEHIRLSIRRSLSFTRTQPTSSSGCCETSTLSGSPHHINNINIMASPGRRAFDFGNTAHSYQHLRGANGRFGGAGDRRGVRIKSIMIGLVSCLVLWLMATKSSSASASASASALRGHKGRKNSKRRYSKLLRSVGRMPPTSLSGKEWDAINNELDRMDLGEVLGWGVDTFGNRLVDVTSFGYSGMVVLHKMGEAGLLGQIPVVTIDTLHLFDETYNFIDQVRNEMSITTFSRYAPKDYDQRAGFDEAYGADLWKTEPDRYNYLSKVEPTMRALDELDAAAWITGRRRDQGGERTEIRILEVDKSDKSRYKFNPLANWSYEEIWAYMHDNNVPYNPLHDRGYKSVGDYMTTAPVDQGAGERSGRFVGLGRTECGIHSTRKKIKRMRQEAEKAGRDFEGMASLPCPGCDYEISPETFDDIVFGGGSSSKEYEFLLLEFYSPLCGGCQEFAPKFKKIIAAIKQKATPGQIKTGRYDITEHDVPKSGADRGISIEATPDLYLVKKSAAANSNPTIIHYDGEHEVEPILQWISKETGVQVEIR